jgi:hypothetical protein
MAIELRLTEETSSISSGDFANPLCFTFNGSMGGVQEKQLYAKNTDQVTAYTVQVQASTGAANPKPYTIWLKKTGANESWVSTPIDLGEMSANGTQAFYVKIELQSDVKVQNFKDLQIQVTETPV